MDPTPKNASPGPRCLGDPASPHRITVAPGKKHPKPGIWMAGGGKRPPTCGAWSRTKAPLSAVPKPPQGWEGCGDVGPGFLGPRLVWEGSGDGDSPPSLEVRGYFGAGSSVSRAFHQSLI